MSGVACGIVLFGSVSPGGRQGRCSSTFLGQRAPRPDVCAFRCRSGASRVAARPVQVVNSLDWSAVTAAKLRERCRPRKNPST